MTAIKSHKSELTPICQLHIEKMDYAVLPVVFKIAIPAFPVPLTSYTFLISWDLSYLKRTKVMLMESKQVWQKKIRLHFSLNQPHWADSVIESQCLDVCLRHRMHFFFRPLIGPDITWSVPRPLIGPPSLPHSIPPSLGTWKFGNLETWKLGHSEIFSDFQSIGPLGRCFL